MEADWVRRSYLLTESLLENSLLNYMVNFVIDVLRTWVSSKCEIRGIRVCHNDSQSLLIISL
jgi:hypothetical protein